MDAKDTACAAPAAETGRLHFHGSPSQPVVSAGTGKDQASGQPLSPHSLWYLGHTADPPEVWIVLPKTDQPGTAPHCHTTGRGRAKSKPVSMDRPGNGKAPGLSLLPPRSMSHDKRAVPQTEGYYSRNMMCFCITHRVPLQMPVFTAGMMPGCETCGDDHAKLGALDSMANSNSFLLTVSRKGNLKRGRASLASASHPCALLHILSSAFFSDGNSRRCKVVACLASDECKAMMSLINKASSLARGISMKQRTSRSEDRWLQP